MPTTRINSSTRMRRKSVSLTQLTKCTRMGGGRLRPLYTQGGRYTQKKKFKCLHVYTHDVLFETFTHKRPPHTHRPERLISPIPTVCNACYVQVHATAIRVHISIWIKKGVLIKWEILHLLELVEVMLSRLSVVFFFLLIVFSFTSLFRIARRH